MIDVELCAPSERNGFGPANAKSKIATCGFLSWIWAMLDENLSVSSRLEDGTTYDGCNTCSISQRGSKFLSFCQHFADQEDLTRDHNRFGRTICTPPVISMEFKGPGVFISIALLTNIRSHALEEIIDLTDKYGCPECQ